MRETDKTEKIVRVAFLVALTCVATMMIKVPSPMKGYLNVGDCVVLVAGWMLSPAYGFLAAGLGSAMADIFSGYLLYAPATFLIKGAMAAIACWGFKVLHKKISKFFKYIISGIIAESVMILGYYVFEGLLYGFGPAFMNVPANIVQGILGLVLGVMLMKMFVQSKIAK